jgi:hypothetical protein
MVYLGDLYGKLDGTATTPEGGGEGRKVVHTSELVAAW